MNFQSQQEHNLVPIMNPILVSSDGGNKVNILGIPMVIRIHGRDTGGVVSAVESHDVPGGGPPPHIHHREDETFQVLEGEYEWTVGGKTFIAKKGATIFAPRCMKRRLGRGNADSLQIRDHRGKPAHLLAAVGGRHERTLGAGSHEHDGRSPPDRELKRECPRAPAVSRQHGCFVLVRHKIVHEREQPRRATRREPRLRPVF